MRRCGTWSCSSLSMCEPEPSDWIIASGSPGIPRIAMKISKAQVDAQVEAQPIQDGVMLDPSGPYVIAWYEESQQRRLPRRTGILLGATLAAIAQKLPEVPAGATVLGFNYDTGERYLSIEGFLPA